MISFPKSFESPFNASNIEEALNTYIPIDANTRSHCPSVDFSSSGTKLAITSGSVGFSTKSVILASSPILRSPRPEASSVGTGLAATVTSAPLARCSSTILEMSIRYN